MSCGLADIELRFRSSGIRVRPIKVDSYKKSKKHDHARIRVTREAGDHIVSNHDRREPVELWSEGLKIERFYIPDSEQAISLTEDDAYLRLYDQMRLLDQRNVNEQFTDSHSYADIVDELVEKAKDQDPNGVLEGWSPPSDNDLEADTSFSLGNLRNSLGLVGADENVANSVAGATGTDFPLLGGVAESIAISYKNNSWSLFNEDAGMDFEDSTVLEALGHVAEQLEANVYMDNYGYLHIGPPQHNPALFVGGMKSDFLNMINVSTAFSGQRIKKAVVRGPRVEKQKRAREDNDGQLRYEAVANRTDIDTGQIVFKEAVDVAKGDLGDVAEKLLVNTVRESNSGNLTVDVLSSGKQVSNIKMVRIGDFFRVTEYTNCRKDIPGGLFIVTGVHHKINSRDGWKVNISVTEVMGDSPIYKTSYIVDVVDEEFQIPEPNEDGSTDYENPEDGGSNIAA